MKTNQNFCKGVLDPKTRIPTLRKGFLGADFDISEKDEKILEKIGHVSREEFKEKLTKLLSTNGANKSDRLHALL